MQAQKLGSLDLVTFTASAIGCTENLPGARNARCLQKAEKWIRIDYLSTKHVLLGCTLYASCFCRSNLR